MFDGYNIVIPTERINNLVLLHPLASISLCTKEAIPGPFLNPLMAHSRHSPSAHSKLITWFFLSFTLNPSNIDQFYFSIIDFCVKSVITVPKYYFD